MFVRHVCVRFFSFSVAFRRRFFFLPKQIKDHFYISASETAMRNISAYVKTVQVTARFKPAEMPFLNVYAFIRNKPAKYFNKTNKKKNQQKLPIGH